MTKNSLEIGKILVSDQDADKWIFQKLGNPQTLGNTGGQRWN